MTTLQDPENFPYDGIDNVRAELNRGKVVVYLRANGNELRVPAELFVPYADRLSPKTRIRAADAILEAVGHEGDGEQRNTYEVALATIPDATPRDVLTELIQKLTDTPPNRLFYS
ncbi:MAG: hypothetical protein HY368_02340 [Candidatus Aenigmarchaeota archaeon]|nr:hypothetical protein [Candidatus Aenigmarchaeota archaeon]